MRPRLGSAVIENDHNLFGKRLTRIERVRLTRALRVEVIKDDMPADATSTRKGDA